MTSPLRFEAPAARRARGRVRVRRARGADPALHAPGERRHEPAAGRERAERACGLGQRGRRRRCCSPPTAAAAGELRPVPGAEALDFRDVDAFDDKIAYVLSIGPGEASRIFKTRDGGASWDEQFRNRDPEGVPGRDGVLGRAPRRRGERLGRGALRDPGDAGRRTPLDARSRGGPARGACRTRGRSRRAGPTWRCSARTSRGSRPRPAACCGRETAAARGALRRRPAPPGPRPGSSRSPSATPGTGVVVGGDYKKEGRSGRQRRVQRRRRRQLEARRGLSRLPLGRGALGPAATDPLLDRARAVGRPTSRATTAAAGADRGSRLPRFQLQPRRGGGLLRRRGGPHRASRPGVPALAGRSPKSRS